MNTALLLSQRGVLGDGELGYVSDSGGLRELFVDTSAGHGLPFARLTAKTTAKLAARLPHGLDPVNPLDAAGSFTPDYAGVFRDCVRHLMEDPNVALGVFEFEARDAFIYMPELIEVAKEVKTYRDKPFLVINTFSGALNAGIADDLMDHDVPLINGVEQAVRAIAKVLQWREYQRQPPAQAPSSLCPATLARWKARIATGSPLSETESLTLLADFGIPVAAPTEAHNLRQALDAAQSTGYPVVLKTAEPGIHHKSDVDGVRLNLADSAEVKQAYLSLGKRLGPRVTVEPMVADGIELAFGMVTDPQFGPLVMVGCGGIYIEILRDRCFSLAPFDCQEAQRMLDSLKIRPLLDGARGRPACDLDVLARTLSRFSELAAALADVVAEIDINPLIVGAHNCIAVDALVIGQAAAPVELAC
jgi:acyl-CoA synthetase (NDP forming)